MLASIVTAKDWQTFTNRGSNHERICGTQTILIWLSQCELFEIQSELANIWCLLNGDLTSFGSILSSWVVWIHKGGLIHAGCSTTSELLQEVIGLVGDTSVRLLFSFVTPNYSTSSDR